MVRRMTLRSGSSLRHHPKIPSILILLSILSMIFIPHVPVMASHAARSENKQNKEDDEMYVYDLLGVERPSNAPRIFRRLSWRLHQKILPLLHWGDASQAKDVDVNLRVLWAKAISSLDSNSLAYEEHEKWTYLLLPPRSRWLLRRIIPVRLFPRWLHANIELRTVYLDRLIQEEIESVSSAQTKIRVIVLGGGYDARCLRLLNAPTNSSRRRRIDVAWELDQASVVQSKHIMLDRIQRQLKKSIRKPHGRAVDLADGGQLERTLGEIMSHDDGSDDWFTILVSEAVLMYLPSGTPSRVLSTCEGFLRRKRNRSSFVFAERFEGVNANDQTALRRFLAKAGWKLKTWQPKPGRTNHMGKAYLI